MRNNSIKSDFPFFSSNPSTVWLDSAATTQKPECVIYALTEFYNNYNSNVFRGEYPAADKATRLYVESKEKVARFFGSSAENVVFTFNATDSLNMAAYALKDRVSRGKNVAVSVLEHNSALLPWMKICADAGAEIRYIPIDKNGALDFEADGVIDDNTCAAVVTAGSNVSGYRAPLGYVCDLFAKKNIPLIIDASQAAPHERIDVSNLTFDFMCISAHKMYGPMGLGLLILGKKTEVNSIYRLGGGDVEEVNRRKYVLKSGSAAFESGTPNVAGAYAFGAALDYLSSLDLGPLWKEERRLANVLRQELTSLGASVAAGGNDPLPVVSFAFPFMHPLDMAKVLGTLGFCVRDGKHCAHIAHEALGFDATVRVSLGIYNTEDEISDLLEKIKYLKGRYER
ncbi:MAG: aminotransferase class V-fold PLP-dependent enzyme [Clostridia bacterium]|nr:aminotransferase class V-fold PLP-dependent enzyme [Clostridia bacterium]